MVRVSAGFFSIEPVVQPLGGVATFQLAVNTCWQLSCRYLRPVLVTTLCQLTNLHLDTGLLGSFFSHISCSLLSRAWVTGYLGSSPVWIHPCLTRTTFPFHARPPPATSKIELHRNTGYSDSKSPGSIPQSDFPFAPCHRVHVNIVYESFTFIAQFTFVTLLHRILRTFHSSCKPHSSQFMVASQFYFSVFK